MRLPTLTHERRQLDAIQTRQDDVARLQTRVASGLRVQSPGDDPLAAAQAERARSQLARLAQDRRSADFAGGVLATAEGALGQGIDALQFARETLIAAGNGGHTPSDRAVSAQQLRTARAQLLAVANTRDGAGGHVFGGQGSTAAPVAGNALPVYAPAAGEQRVGEAGRYAASVDGRAAFLAVPPGNGTFVTASAAGNSGSGWIAPGSVADPAQLTGHGYRLDMASLAGSTVYRVTDTTTAAVLADQVPFVPGSDIVIDGQRVAISGMPAAGDAFTLAPATPQSMFRALDEAIALLEAPATPAALAEGLARGQASLDQALDRLGFLRTRVGEELRVVDQGTAAGEVQTLAVTARRSELRDLDMAQGISQLQGSQVALEAALKSYSALSRSNLFDLLR